MRCARLAFALVAIAATLFAAEPVAGTWKWNSAKYKSKTGGTPPKEVTVTISESASDLDVMVKGTASDDTPISAHYTVPAAGGEGKFLIESPYDAVSSKRLGPDRREINYSKGGKVVLTFQSRVSKDGNTMTPASGSIPSPTPPLAAAPSAVLFALPISARQWHWALVSSLAI